MLNDFISKQTAFNKSVEKKFGKIDVLASKVDSLALDVELLKLKVLPHDVKESKTLNAIQVKIDNNVRMLAELHARWEREDEIARICLRFVLLPPLVILFQKLAHLLL
jgi:L-alanine-DL-glutamate epimerase-like enolase superfamily enzyme